MPSYSSSNTSVATVDENGLVTALKPGKVKIRAYVGKSLEALSTTITVTNNEIKENQEQNTDNKLLAIIAIVVLVIIIVISILFIYRKFINNKIKN